jgi:hypothetical protein
MSEYCLQIGHDRLAPNRYLLYSLPFSALFHANNFCILLVKNVVKIYWLYTGFGLVIEFIEFLQSNGKSRTRLLTTADAKSFTRMSSLPVAW